MTTLLLVAQCGLTLSIAAWIATGALDNWLHPRLNLDAVRMVVSLEAMAREYPAEYAGLAHRRMTDPRRIAALFYLIVAWESLTALLLLAGAALLGAAALGAETAEAGRMLATLGAVAFTLCWAGFLAGGNYFGYWYCHFPAQATHFFLAIWGSLVTGILILSP